MESLSAVLQPYKEQVGSVASVITIIHFLAGAIICLDIHKRGSTRGLSAIQFIGGVVTGVLMLKYGFMLNDPAMLQVNVFAIFLHLIYTACFYHYTEHKYREVVIPSSFGAALTAVLLGYTEWESPDLVEYRYGFIVTVLMLMVLGSPLVELKKIINKKDASSIPLPTTLMAAVTSFLWLIYGVIILNVFMVVQNIIGLFLCAAQLILLFIYRGSSGIKQD